MDRTSTGQFTRCADPATDRDTGVSPLHSLEDLQSAITRSGNAQKLWAGSSLDCRIGKVRRIGDYLMEHLDDLAVTISMDNGKSLVDSLSTEILPALMAVNYYCRNARTFLKDRRLNPGNIFMSFKRSKVVRAPYGVIGIITPWNYPFSIPFSEVITAILAGNGVILKTATETQMTGLALKKSMDAAGLPEHLFSFINMPGKTAGEAFLEKGVDKLFFTGSVSVGKLLMKKASETLTPICLELGGKDAMLVCEDADLERAANGAVWAGFQNSGQSCGGVERIYVHGKIYNEFLELLKEKTESLRPGHYTSYNSDMGCMTTGKQIEKVKKHIEDAVSKGARVFAQSGMPEDGDLKNFMPAVVLTGVDHEMMVMKEETFGPVIGVMKVRDMKEAIGLANDSNLGLTGSVWSKNRKKAEKIARRIQAGAVTINDHLMSHGLAETSWGGFKQSGIGRTHGELGFHEMTQPMFLVDDLLSFTKRNLWWHPYSRKLYDGLKGTAEMLYGKGIRKRVKGFINLSRILRRLFS